MRLDVDFNIVFDFIDTSCLRDKVGYNWSKCTPNELTQYCCLTYDLFTDIHVTPGIKCNNPNCEISSHKSDIDFLYKQICDHCFNYHLLRFGDIIVKSIYHLVKQIVIRNTLYQVLMNM